MTWPDRPPSNRRLHLFVRYTTADGRNLEAKRLIDVDPPGSIPLEDMEAVAADRQARRWTPVAPTVRSDDAARPGRPNVRPVAVPTTPRPSPAIRPPTRVATRPARPQPDPEPDSPRRSRPAWSPYRQ